MILEAGQPNMEAIHASVSYILLFQKPISFHSLLLEAATHIFIGELFPSRKELTVCLLKEEPDMDEVHQD